MRLHNHIIKTAICLSFLFSCKQINKVPGVQFRNNEIRFEHNEPKIDQGYPSLDSVIVSIVPDPYSSKIDSLLREDAEGSKNILMNKSYPYSLAFQTVDKNLIVVEFYYLAMRDNYIDRKIEKYLNDTIYISFRQSITRESTGKKIVFFRTRLYISIDNASKVKSITLIR